MDINCKRVLKKKRFLLCEVLDFSALSQKTYKKKGILTDKMVPDIMVEKSNTSQVLKWLDGLPELGKDAFQKLLDLLEEQNHPWLKDELTVDLMAEKGELQIEDYVYKEAGVIVRRHWGSSKRLSELDKKTIQNILANQHQVAKMAYNQTLRNTRDELEKTHADKEQMDRQLNDLTEQIMGYLEIQKEKINGYIHDMVTPTQVLHGTDVDNHEQASIEEIEKAIQGLLDVFVRIVFEKDILTDEKMRCLNVLQVKGVANKLDVLIKDKLDEAAAELVEAKEAAEICSQMAQSMETQIHALKTENRRKLVTKERVLVHQDTLIKEKEEETEELERSLIQMQIELDDVISEMTEWKKRCEMLEKTRRMGYYNPDWQRTYRKDWKSMTKQPKEPQSTIEKRTSLPQIQVSSHPLTTASSTDEELGNDEILQSKRKYRHTYKST